MGQYSLLRIQQKVVQKKKEPTKGISRSNLMTIFKDQKSFMSITKEKVIRGTEGKHVEFTNTPVPINITQKAITATLSDLSEYKTALEVISELKKYN